MQLAKSYAHQQQQNVWRCVQQMQQNILASWFSSLAKMFGKKTRQAFISMWQPRSWISKIRQIYMKRRFRQNNEKKTAKKQISWTKSRGLFSGFFFQNPRQLVAAVGKFRIRANFYSAVFWQAVQTMIAVIYGLVWRLQQLLAWRCCFTRVMYLFFCWSLSLASFRATCLHWPIVRLSVRLHLSTRCPAYVPIYPLSMQRSSRPLVVYQCYFTSFSTRRAVRWGAGNETHSDVLSVSYIGEICTRFPPVTAHTHRRQISLRKIFIRSPHPQIFHVTPYYIACANSR